MCWVGSQGTALQQLAFVMHACPGCAHVLEVCVQVPLLAPTGVLQIKGAQQSPLLVQVPSAGTHIALWQRSTPDWSRVQGTLLQQSPIDAHTPPAGTQ
jgi:hypothetical protein